MVENTANSTHRLVTASTISVSSGATVTNSVYAKAGERTWLVLSDGGSSGVSTVYFDLANGAFGTVSAGAIQYSATNVGSGWYRIEYTCLLAGSVSQPFIGAASANNTNSYTGDGVSGVYVYGAQVERASTASAYQRITNFNGDFSAAFPSHALYQESVGPTPVSALGQSVGLVLDKRLGPPGPELVANGTFANGTGWSFGSGWELGDGVAVGISASGSLQYPFPSINGATYRVQFDWKHDGGIFVTRVGAGTGVNLTTSGTHVLYVVGGASTNFGVEFYGGATTGFIDNVSVRLVSGNHALQATSASRPTLQARSNLLAYTEQFDNAAWSNAGTGQTTTANAIVAPDGTMTADLQSGDGSVTSQGKFQAFTFTGDGEKCASVYLREGTGNTTVQLGLYDATAATYRHRISVTWTAGVPSLATVSGSGTRYPVESLGNGWYRISYSATGIVAANTNRWYLLTSGATATAGSVYVWGAQAENAVAPTTYQRVVTATDYADIGLPRNLTFDGVDDSLATTGNVDLSGTDKATAFAGVSKLSDAARAILFELGNSLNNRVSIEAPPAATATYQWSAGGSILSGTISTTTYAAPVTSVLTGTNDIAADSCVLRVNGAFNASSSVDQGTGNYASAVLYLGRRGGATLPFNGRLFQLIITGQLVGAPVPVEQWVAQRTGVTI